LIIEYSPHMDALPAPTTAADMRCSVRLPVPEALLGECAMNASMCELPKNKAGGWTAGFAT
jgi:hypothetical protein